jgi:RNA polymerase sigma factor (sigma-70 family)
MQNTLESQAIVTHHKMVHHIAKKFKPRNSNELEDYVQIGYIGLIKAVRKYDKSKAKFSTMAWNYIKWEIMRHLSKHKIDNIIYDSSLISNIVSATITNEHEELMPFNLSPNENNILKLKLEGYSMREIAGKLKMSSYNLKTKYKQIINNLHEEKTNINVN